MKTNPYTAADLRARFPDEGLESEDIRNFDLMNLVRAELDMSFENRASHERQVSNFLHVTRETYDGQQGIPFPVGALTGQRDLAVGTATKGAELVETSVANSIIGTKENQPIVLKAGATVLPNLTGNVQLPRATAAPSAAWLTETGTVTESDPQFDTVTLTPKRLTGCVEISRKLLIQSSPAISDYVRRELLRQILLAIDLAAINGSGTNNQPEGILNTSGIGAYSATSGADAATWDMLVGLWKEVAIDNTDVGALSWLVSPAALAEFAKTRMDTGSGRFMVEDLKSGILGSPVYCSNQVPSDLGSSGALAAVIVGNFADVVIATWGGPTVIVNPYTQAKSGVVSIVVEQFCDVAVLQPSSFGAVQDLVIT